MICVHPEGTLAQRRLTATITVDTSRPVNRFSPAHALGAAIDGHELGLNDLQLKSDNIKAMLTAGLKPLTYRLRTELGIDVWHWNPNGSWSDQNKKEGYWVSDSKLAQPISLSYGYALPRRGNTIDQAGNNGYSRLDDGDEQTFWKSNPYLDAHFTGEDNALHPQWIVIQLARPEPINAIRILWGEPFAKRFRVQYGNFDDPSVIALSPTGTWSDFPNGVFDGSRNQSGQPDRVLRLSPKPIRTSLIRILLTESWGDSRAKTGDVRDAVGFAVRELYLGTLDDQGVFHDRLRHARKREDQTIMHVSSTDPWHRQTDRDKDIEQIGLDRLYQTGLTNDLPMLVPTGLLYDTPENAANEIRYLRARGYKFDQVELGEEPDGQYITPEDFGALYLQFADAIHQVDPKLQLGGPSFQEILPSHDPTYPIDNASWMRRFLAYLKQRQRLNDFNFFSFEWYPFDNICAPPAPQLARAQRMLADAMRTLEQRGTVPRNIPWIISEYGYSAFAGRAEISIEGALMHADIVGEFLALGGDQAYLYGYAPDVVIEERDCTAGNNMLFEMDDDGKITHRFATYFAARLMSQEWLQPGDGLHEIYAASSDVKDENGNTLVAAYPVKRADGLWSVLLINKDPKRSFELNLAFRTAGNGNQTKLKAPVDVYQYSEAQYVLGGPAKDPYPVRALPPVHQLINSPQKAGAIVLPPYSLTVVRSTSAQ
ncbi:MAG TPA: discoidin domain-containing protein [Pyrinomonadaceae bacterium]|nr:discoidin domain-containing protein [Pyrinomonadaceae bacterium]